MRGFDLKESRPFQRFLGDPVRRAVAPGYAYGNFILRGADDLSDVLVAESWTEQDGLDLFFSE
jgi:hypothetical protein